MKNIINNDRETRREQKLENSNSEEVKGFQRNSEIWNNGHHTGAQYGIELAVFELMKGIRKKYPLFAQHIQYRAEDTFKAIPEIVECIVSVCDEVNSQNENPDAGMEERERQMACAKVGRQMSKDMEGKDD